MSAQVDAMADVIIADIRARGIAVAILVPPFHPAAYDQAGAFLENANVAIGEFARNEHVPVIDCRSVVTAADFRDLDHLQAAGAAKHSRCVGDQLRSLMPS